MAVYATVKELQSAVARDPSQTNGSAASLDPITLTGCLDQAEAEVNARLAGRYQTPFPGDAVPALVHSITLDIAAYRAALIWKQEKELANDSPPVLRYRMAMELLMALARGEADLPDDPSDPDDGVVIENSVGTPVNANVGWLSAEFLYADDDPYGRY